MAAPNASHVSVPLMHSQPRERSWMPSAGVRLLSRGGHATPGGHTSCSGSLAVVLPSNSQSGPPTACAPTALKAVQAGAASHAALHSRAVWPDVRFEALLVLLPADGTWLITSPMGM